MKVIFFILVTWILVFWDFCFPARPIGKWMARRDKGRMSVILDIILCAVIAFNVALLGWLALMVWGADFLPHVKSDPVGFGMFFAEALLFVPAFLAFLVGYLRARKMVEAQ